MRTRVLLIDNHDSFTYNLVQGLRVLGAAVIVRTHDSIDLQGARAAGATHLVVSPGPGRPENAGRSPEILAGLMERIPTLGVCLGHQCLAAVLGARIVRARTLVHGKASPVYHDGRTLYEGLPNPFEAGRYHSLAVEPGSLPDSLSVVARTSDGEIMGLRHRRLPVEGVQFHPESVLTPDGQRLLANFIGLRPRRGGGSD